MTTTYSPDNMVLIVEGVPIVGFMEGSEINVASESDRYAVTHGTAMTPGGLSAYVRSKEIDKGATMTFTLMCNSPSNTLLSGLMARDTLNNTGEVPVFLKDASNAGTQGSGTGWVHKAIDFKSPIGGGSPSREWTIRLGAWTQNIQGSAI